MVTAVSSRCSQDRPRHMAGVWETLKTYVQEGHRLASSVQNGLLLTFPALSSPHLKDRGVGIPVDGAVGIKGQGVSRTPRWTAGQGILHLHRDGAVGRIERVSSLVMLETHHISRKCCVFRLRGNS